MDEAGLADFEALLAHSDHVICDLVLGDAPPPPGIDAVLLARMRAFVRSGGAALR
jgi:succinate dehydrogenase flavin-adding protein (antitoxin of CptAB toxin-antitoxin module)